MISVIRVLPIEYFVFELIFSLFVLGFIFYKRDFVLFKIFIFGSFCMGVIEGISFLLGFRTYSVFPLIVFFIVSITEGGAALTTIWFLSNFVFKKYKEKYKE